MYKERNKNSGHYYILTWRDIYMNASHVNTVNPFDILYTFFSLTKYLIRDSTVKQSRTLFIVHVIYDDVYTVGISMIYLYAYYISQWNWIWTIFGTEHNAQLRAAGRFEVWVEEVQFKRGFTVVLTIERNGNNQIRWTFVMAERSDRIPGVCLCVSLSFTVLTNDMCCVEQSCFVKKTRQI